MLFRDQFRNIMQKIQLDDLAHHKQLNLLSTIAQRYDEMDVSNEFLTIICHVFSVDYADENPFVSRTLIFLAKAIVKITLKLVTPLETTRRGGRPMNIYDISDCSFFNAILNHILKFALTKNNSPSKFNLAFFITHLFQNFNTNMEFGYNICDKIVDHILHLLNERNQKIRIQAIKALFRLQEPTNPDCPVVSTFTTLFYDSNHAVRGTAIEQTAPSFAVLPLLIERLFDVADTVSERAFIKLCDINPRIHLKIEERLTILEFALTQRSKKIATLFKEKLIPTWLNHFGSNHLEFIASLHLDEEENKFEHICEKLVMIFLEIHRVETVIEHLPFDKVTKTIPVDEIKLAHVLFWSTVINYLRNGDNERYLEKLVPELTYFTTYVKTFITNHYGCPREDWENMLFQKVVYHLFKICASYNFGDEAGRRSLYSLIEEVLTKYEFDQNVIECIVSIGFLANNDIESFTMDMVSIIKNVVSTVPARGSEESVANLDFRLTRLKVKMHRLQIEEEGMVKIKDFKRADVLHREWVAINENCMELQRQLTETEKMKVSQNDSQRTARGLDILAAVLKLESVVTITPALEECKTNFLLPLDEKMSRVIHARFITCVALFSMLSLEVATEWGKIVCIPLLSYRPGNLGDKEALVASISSVTDLIRLHGLEIVGIVDEQPAALDVSRSNKRRRLHNDEVSEEEETTQEETQISGSQVTSILMDIIDENDDELFHVALKSTFQLMLLSKVGNPKLLSTLLCQTYKHVINNHFRYLYVINIIKCFINSKPDSKEMLRKAIVRTVKMMSRSCYKEKDSEGFHAQKMLKFFANYTIEKPDMTHDSDFIWDIIKAIAAKPKKTFGLYLAILLKNLNLPYNANMLNNVENIAKQLENNATRRHLLSVMKLIKKQAPNNINDQQDADECSSLDSGKSVSPCDLGRKRSIEQDDDLPSASSKVLTISSPISPTHTNDKESNKNVLTRSVRRLNKNKENEGVPKTNHKEISKKNGEERSLRKSALSSEGNRRLVRSSNFIRTPKMSSDDNNLTTPMTMTLSNKECFEKTKSQKTHNDVNVKTFSNSRRSAKDDDDNGKMNKKTITRSKNIAKIIDNVCSPPTVRTPRRIQNEGDSDETSKCNTPSNNNKTNERSAQSKTKTRSITEKTSKKRKLLKTIENVCTPPTVRTRSRIQNGGDMGETSKCNAISSNNKTNERYAQTTKTKTKTPSITEKTNKKRNLLKIIENVCTPPTVRTRSRIQNGGDMGETSKCNAI